MAVVVAWVAAKQSVPTIVIKRTPNRPTSAVLHSSMVTTMASPVKAYLIAQAVEVEAEAQPATEVARRFLRHRRTT